MLPTPNDSASAPVWENYIVSQVAQASLGQIPVHALAMGVQVNGPQVWLRFQLSECSDLDVVDMDDILSELAALVGDRVQVELHSEVLTQRAVNPSDGVRWIFLARP